MPDPVVDPQAPVAELSPTGKAIVPQQLVRYAVALIAVAATVHSFPDLGIQIPALAMKIDNAVLAFGLILGITSQGVRK